MSTKLKEEFLKLLKEDEEFRYAVAGYIGLERFWKEIKSLREEANKIWKEIKLLREEQILMREEQTKIWREIGKLREEQKLLREEQILMREDFNRMVEVLLRMDKRLTRVEKTLEKLTVDIEEEARSIVRYKLRELGIKMDVEALKLPELELNLYGVSDGICIIGEASVRAGASIVDELKRKLEILKTKYPNYLREKIILVLYVTLPLPELVERSKKENIWLLKATREYVRPKFQFKF